MANKNSNYWRKRTLQLENALHNKGIEYYYDLERLYTRAARETEKEISKLYSRLATENEITLSEAKKLLTSNELDEFRWSVQEYIKYGKKNTVDKLWTKQLENASLKYRISRLEAMKIHMQQQVEVLMGNELDSFSKVMTDIYTEGYYRNAHIIQTGLGVGHSFATLDTNKIEKVLSKPWVGDKNFSQRIWGDHRTKLVNDLHTHLTQSIIRGESPDRVIKFISQKYDVAKHRAGNLVMTESAYFGTKAQQDCYKELDVEMQEFVATLDHRTSDVCQAMDGKVFKSNELEIGINCPPLHGRCRSVMVPYFEDNITERAARGKDGKTVYIKGNMKYSDWKKQFVEGGDGVDLTKTVVSALTPPTIATKKTTKQAENRVFPNSKVVDDNNNLIELYHGTANGDFDEFDPTVKGQTFAEQGHFYFSNSQKVSSTYTKRKFNVDEKDFLELPKNLKYKISYTKGKNTEIILDVDEFGKSLGTGVVGKNNKWGQMEFGDEVNISDDMLKGAKVTKYEMTFDDDTPLAMTSYPKEQKTFNYFARKNFTIENSYTEKSVIKKVYLDMKKPFVVDYKGKNYNDVITIDGKTFGKVSSYAGQGTPSLREIERYAKENGYDGVIAKNVKDGGGLRAIAESDKIATDYIVFNKKQIKIIGNLELSK